MTTERSACLAFSQWTYRYLLYNASTANSVFEFTAIRYATAACVENARRTAIRLPLHTSFQWCLTNLPRDGALFNLKTPCSLCAVLSERGLSEAVSVPASSDEHFGQHYCLLVRNTSSLSCSAR